MSSSSKDHKQHIKQSLKDNILITREVTSYLKLTETTVCNLVASVELPGFKIGKSRRFDRGEVMWTIDAAKRKSKKLL